MSTLRNRAIRLAAANPKLRPHILKAIQAADEEAGKHADEIEARFKKDDEEGFQKWLDANPDIKKDWEANKDKYKDKFKDKAASLFVLANRTANKCKNLPNEALIKKCLEKANGGSEDSGDDEGGKKAAERSLRNATIRLAAQKPHLRKFLLPILAETK